ncbi:hypothetical protein GPL19_10320 [Enterocloster bolteae]|nr:hypothetical protein [Enterocloster bolteae]MBT9826352.1 hypothetical protein [Enterocloster bolteae]
MNSEKGENIMLLTDVVLRAVISITLTQTPAKESIYVGKIILAKDGKEYTFDFDTCTIDIIDHTVVIECAEGESEDEDFPDGATMEELEGAAVTDLFLQGDEESYIEGQAVKNIELMLYGVADPTRKIVFKKDAFKETDLGEYYDITWE